MHNPVHISKLCVLVNKKVVTGKSVFLTIEAQFYTVVGFGKILQGGGYVGLMG